MATVCRPSLAACCLLPPCCLPAPHHSPTTHQLNLAARRRFPKPVADSPNPVARILLLEFRCLNPPNLFRTRYTASLVSLPKSDDS